MITLVKATNKEQFIEGMRAAFYNDVDLNKYHIKPSDDYEEMVQDSISNIYIVKGELAMDNYLVYWNDVLIGFTCISIMVDLLYSFGINVEYRNRVVVREWLSKVQDIIFKQAPHMNVLLYSKNTRAINFFRKNGFNFVFQNKRMYGSDPASLLIKRRFQKSIKMVNELEFEEGLG